MICVAIEEVAITGIVGTRKASGKKKEQANINRYKGGVL